jgi:cell division protein FtsL
MARQDLDLLLERAQADARQPQKSASRDKRYIYNGESQARNPSYAVRENRKVVHRKVSTFTLILWIFGVGIAIVLYVDNIIAINHLAMEVNQLQTKYDAIMNTNATLRAEVTRKSAWERIGKNATEQLGLVFPTEQPTLFSVDQEKIESLRKQ